MEIKEIKTKINNVVFDTQPQFNQQYINDLTRIIKTNTAVPTHTPKKFIDCFYLYWDGSTTYELYIYINNSWKKVTLS
jgi:hypothetical protein